MLIDGIPRNVVADIGLDIIEAINTHFPRNDLHAPSSQRAMSAFIYAVALIIRTAHEPPLDNPDWWIEGLREAYELIIEEEARGKVH